MKSDYEPKVIGFLCNWCSYAGADMAGTSRMKYPVDPLFVVKCFQRGADGVLVSGCHPGDCHYTEGNYHTRRRFTLLREFLDYLGIAKERLRVEWVSASEGQKFAELLSDFTTELAELGPRSRV